MVQSKGGCVVFVSQLCCYLMNEVVAAVGYFFMDG